MDVQVRLLQRCGFYSMANCSLVTLYGANDNTNLPCSSPLKIVGKKAMCYNSSWVYYSVDNCVKPGSSSIILPSTASSLSPVTFTLATESSASASASQTNVAGSLEQPSRTGIIVGAIVGGVCIFAILFALALFCLRRRAKPAKPLPCPPSYELSQEHALIEASQSAVVPPNRTLQKEMWAHEVAVEIGRNSYAPPVELPAHDIGSDKKRMSSLIHVHMAR